MRRALRLARRHPRGFTLVELMVAMIIALLVVAATTAFYLMTRTTYTAIDDSSNLEERGQFAMGVIARALRQTAFSPPSLNGGGVIQLSVADLTTAPMVMGLDGCTSPADAEQLSCSGTPTPTASDALEVRFFGSGTTADPTVPDNTIVDCSGQGVASPTSLGTAATQRGLSIFFVQKDTNGNSYLACKFRQRSSTGVEDTSGTASSFVTQQLVPGVEYLQILYGVSADGNAVPDVFKPASSMSSADWLNVTAVKVAMVIRSDNNTASTSTSGGTTSFTMFGSGYGGTTGDQGALYTPTTNLSAARRLFTTTIQARNYMTCYTSDLSCI